MGFLLLHLMKEPFFTTQPTGIELSQFFEGMDEDGNPQDSGEFNKNRENGRKLLLENQSITKRQQQLPDDSATPVKDKKVESATKQEAVLKKQTAVVKPNKPSSGNSDKRKPTKPSVEQKLNKDMVFQQKSDKAAIQKKPLAPQQNVNLRNVEKQSVRKKPLPPQQDKLKTSGDASIQVKLEASKRKLQERYQEAENAKRQRTIQVMELHDIPKHGAGQNPNMKPGNYHHSRNWANGRR